MKTIDRYVIRQTLWPAFLGLLVFTFLLIIPIVLKTTEELIAKGVSTPVILRLIVTLLPQALGLSIPMSLLLGILVAFGRLSSDREWVAMQACGISMVRLLRPVMLVSGVAFGVTLYILLAALPQANQSYREIMFGILSERAEGEVKPRVFFQDFPDLVLYVRDVPRAGGWNDIFMADSRPGRPQAIYLAKRGRVAINREQRTVEMVLADGTSHVADRNGEYQVTTFKELIFSVNPDTVFPRIGPNKGEREMSIPELRTRIAELDRSGQSSTGPHVEIYKKFSIPFACIVLGLIGLSLGASNRRDGRLASFVIGILVIFTYYALLESGSNLAKARFIPPWLAVWLPNIAFGTLAIWLFIRRLGATDRPSRLLSWIAGLRPTSSKKAPWRPAGAGGFGSWRLPLLGILDRYVMISYLRVFALCLLALLGLFHVSVFIDLSDEVLRGDAQWRQLFSHMWYATPQDMYYVLPMAVLLSTLVTIGLLTRNSEIIVMKACGISLYRVAVPLVMMAIVVTATLGGLQERVMGPSNYRAEAIRHVIRGGSPQTFDVMSRRWVAAPNGDIYNYTVFNQRDGQLVGLAVYHFAGSMDRLLRRTYVERATYDENGDPAGAWKAEQGWSREFDGTAVTYHPFADTRLALEAPSYFSTNRPEPSYMNYEQLRSYVVRLQASGLDVIREQVALEGKLSFPLVTLIMTLIAVPFAVTTGTRGAMYGIGVGIVIAFGYWGAMSVFNALGSAGLMAPVLAAWAPNMLFGAGAAYMVLTART